MNGKNERGGEKHRKISIAEQQHFEYIYEFIKIEFNESFPFAVHLWLITY